MVGELQAGDPRSVGPFQLLGRLGTGGMGQVFLGRSPGGRLVAVKVIRAELAAEPGFRARFAREVAAARNVSGLFTAPVADADVDGAVPWLATAYIAGPSLAEAVESHGPLPLAATLTLAAGLAEGLEAIHAAGVIHRDLKPSNVLLATDGPRVIDFGISRAAEASVLTQSGAVLGSPGFMSPEQAEGGEVGPPSDVFSLGALLTFAATGAGPFGAGSTPALVYRVVHHQPDVNGVPERIRPLVERCLAKDPAQRPTTAELVADCGTDQPTSGWLPAPFAELLGRYGPPASGEPVPGSPPPAAGTDGPPTVASIRRRRVPTNAAVAGPGENGDGPHHRRRRLLWVPIIAGLAALAVAAAIYVPSAINDSAATQAQPPSGTSATFSPSPSAQAPQAVRAVTPSPTPVQTSASAVVTTPTITITATKTRVSQTHSTHSPPTPPTAPAPQIIGVSTYTQGMLVYFSINYSDSDNDAAGFGFVGADGAGWAEEQHPFSSPSYGIVGQDSIDYPFNLECGTAQEYESYVKAWIYDAEGLNSQAVVIHLVCSD
jgi:serine/threonine protein kinase